MLLVTTPLESTWGTNEDIVFLGEWCKLYARKEIWSKRNHLVVPYHWDNRDKLKKDFFHLQKLNKKIIGELTIVLNKLHSVNQNEHYWEILLGHWVNNFTAIIFDRWTMIEKAVELNKITKCYVFNVKDNNLASNETFDFISSAAAINDDSWNQSIYTILIKLNGKIPIEIINNNQSKKPNNKIKSYLKRLLSKFIFNKFSYFSREDDAVVVETSLSLIQELKLQMSLKQFPVLRNFKKLDTIDIDNSFRKWSLNDIKSNDKFYSVIKYLLPKLLPKIYLENYKNLVSNVKKLNLPKAPKFIFTANSHFNSSVFSEYTAQKKSLGAKLILADHGGFGCNAFNGSIMHQLSIADVSFSWGWKDQNYPNVSPLGILKTIQKKITCVENGLGLMVQVAMPRYSFDIRAMPIAGQMNNYFIDQFNFYSLLPEPIRKKFLIRLYPQDLGWDQKKRWQDRFRDVLIDSNKLSMYNLLKKSRLFISTYNATTYMETLSLNVPTIIFWNTNNWEIHDRAKKCFKELEEAGIFHKTPESAALMVSEIWDDISSWWNLEKTQKARINFCDNFAKKVSNPTNEIQQNLLNIINE